MAKNPKATIEKAMPGYRLVEESAQSRGLAGMDDLGAPSADLHGVDFVKLREMYLGASQGGAVARSLDAAGAVAPNTSRLVTVEKASLMDSPRVGRKAAIFDDDDNKIVGTQG
jgi:hypothetical protein